MKKLVWLFLLALAGAPAYAGGGSCAEGWNDTETFDLEGSDLALHSGAPENWDAYGHSDCIAHDDESLDQFRMKVEDAFRKRVQKNFVKYLKQGLPSGTDMVCRFDGVDGLAGQASFERVSGSTELDKILGKKSCKGGGKRSHFAYAKIPFVDAHAKLRCGPAELMRRWEDACGPRMPASAKQDKPSK